ncbi:SCP domain-containing protein [Paraburkholderia tropica]|uniref:CAP domain-containing protein n=1 Tax=Paraburkholderia tropica TaxID=92647 RepID=UPI001CB5C7D6|nr:CAP domain-containing protein [Paraburkholderia tropica]CAG9230055.1 SCP domain-containing protein [Paraburkholderia tropica]
MKKNYNLAIAAAAAALMLSACGGGGGGDSASGTAASGNSGSNTTSASTGNVTTPTYSASSAQLAVFNTINSRRQACGFPALTENTVLDTAAQAHAAYMGANGGTVTDSEVSGNSGFTGVTYSDRAVKAGFPASAVVGGMSAGFYTNSTLTEADYGEQIAAEWLSGVYHSALVDMPVTQIGVGWNELQYNGFPEIQSSVTIASLQTMTGNLPLTYPCEGTTDVPYQVVGESPTPPNTSGAWGPAISVGANPTDTIRMTSGTLTDTSGNVIAMQVLDSSTDTSGVIKAYEGRAYPAVALSKNTTYTATVYGTTNGVAFTRTFSFTTGTKVG